MEPRREIDDFLVSTNRLIRLLATGTPLDYFDRANLEDAVKRLRSSLFVWESQRHLQPSALPNDPTPPGPSLTGPSVAAVEGDHTDSPTSSASGSPPL
jgi:hypothetical protein